MARPTMRGKDMINGKYGRAFVEIEGQRYDLFNVVNFEAKVNSSNKALQALDRHLDVHMEAGGEGKFTGEAYRPAPMFTKLLRNKKDTLLTIRFDLQITEHDPGFEGGPNTVIYTDCLLDEYTLSKLDVSNTELRESISGTFDDFMVAEEYSTLQGMRR